MFCVHMQDALNYSNFFLDAQKVGTLPVDNPVTWRSDAMTYELGPMDRDITGGYLQGGPAGNLKMTHPTAFSIALLAWGLLEFPTVSLLPTHACACLTLASGPRCCGSSRLHLIPTLVGCLMYVTRAVSTITSHATALPHQIWRLLELMQ